MVPQSPHVAGCRPLIPGCDQCASGQPAGGCPSCSSVPRSPASSIVVTAPPLSSSAQAATWPIAITGRDIVAVAKTGSGKTCGYLLPVRLFPTSCVTHGPTAPAHSRPLAAVLLTLPSADSLSLLSQSHPSSGARSHREGGAGERLQERARQRPLGDRGDQAVRDRPGAHARARHPDRRRGEALRPVGERSALQMSAPASRKSCDTRNAAE